MTTFCYTNDGHCLCYDNGNVNVSSILKYVLSHPECETVFPCWSPEQIMMNLINACKDDALYIVVGPNDSLDGLLVADLDHAKREITIQSVLTSTRLAFYTFVRQYAERFPTYTIVGRRRGKLKRYVLRNFIGVQSNERSPVSC